jgi:mucolipin
MNLQHTNQDSVTLDSEHHCQIDQLEERMRRKLRFFFMNPVEKWQAKRRFPYKFIVQVIKIVLVTAQVWIFSIFF